MSIYQMLTLDDPPVSEFDVQPADDDAQRKVSLGRLRRLVRDYNDEEDVIG